MKGRYILGVAVAVCAVCLYITGTGMRSAVAVASKPEAEVERLAQQVIALRMELAKTRGEFGALKHMMLSKKRSHMVTATAYSPRRQETDSTPRETATLTEVTEGRTIAVSQDHVDWLGRRVYIPGYGVRVVEDLMNKRFTDRIDFFFESTAEAQAFGKKKLKVILLD